MKHNLSNSDKILRNIVHTVRFIIGVRAKGETPESQRTEEFTGNSYQEAEQKGRDYIKKNPRRFLIDIIRVPLFWILLALGYWWFFTGQPTAQSSVNTTQNAKQEEVG